METNTEPTIRDVRIEGVPHRVEQTIGHDHPCIADLRPALERALAPANKGEIRRMIKLDTPNGMLRLPISVGLADDPYESLLHPRERGGLSGPSPSTRHSPLQWRGKPRPRPEPRR